MRLVSLAAFAFIVVGALALVPQSAAHISDFSQAKALGLGPYNVIVTPKPSPMFANSALSMTAIFANAADGTYVTSGISPNLILIDASGANQTTRMDPDGTGYYIASLAVAKSGNYTARISVKTESGAFSNDTPFFVYPEVGVRFKPDDPSADTTVGKPTTLVIDTYDPDTLRPKDPAPDLKITFEHWTDDHATLLSAETLNMQRAGTGRWQVDHTFPVQGMYHLRFSSVGGGFKAADVPILHTTATAASATQGNNKVPASTALGAGAIVIAALALRRRP